MGFIKGRESRKKKFKDTVCFNYKKEPNIKREEISFNAINGLLQIFPAIFEKKNVRNICGDDKGTSKGNFAFFINAKKRDHNFRAPSG
jgi:hypothetical protein